MTIPNKDAVPNSLQMPHRGQRLRPLLLSILFNGICNSPSAVRRFSIHKPQTSFFVICPFRSRTNTFCPNPRSWFDIQFVLHMMNLSRFRYEYRLTLTARCDIAREGYSHTPSQRRTSASGLESRNFRSTILYFVKANIRE